MSGVFQNIDPPPPPPHRPASVYPPAFGARGYTLAGWRGGGGSIVRKTPDTALYSIYVSILGPPPSPFCWQNSDNWSPGRVVPNSFPLIRNQKLFSKYNFILDQKDWL